MVKVAFFRGSRAARRDTRDREKPCDSALDHQEPGVYIHYGLGGRGESKS